MNRNLLTIAFTFLFVVQLAFAGDNDTSDSAQDSEEGGEEAGPGDMPVDNYLAPGATDLEGEVTGKDFENPEGEIAPEAVAGEIEAFDEEEANHYIAEEHDDRKALTATLTANAVKKGKDPKIYKESLRGHSTGRLLAKAKKDLKGFKLSTARRVRDEQQALEGHGGIATIGNTQRIVTPALVKGLKAATRQKLLNKFEITPDNMKKFEALAVDRDLVKAHFNLSEDAVSKMNEAAIEAKIRQLIRHHKLTQADGKKRLIFDLRHTRGLIKTAGKDPKGMSHKQMKEQVKAMTPANRAQHKADNKKRLTATHNGTYKAKNPAGAAATGAHKGQQGGH